MKFFDAFREDEKESKAVRGKGDTIKIENDDVQAFWQPHLMDWKICEGHTDTIETIGLRMTFVTFPHLFKQSGHLLVKDI